MQPYYQDSAVTIYHGDCREIITTLGRFDLLLTDPPYGLGENASKSESRCRSNYKWKQAKAKDYGEYNWDSEKVSDDLLTMARDHCRKQIIFGGNYYNLPPCKGWLIWDKDNSGDFADGEAAWNNLGCALRIKRHLWNGMCRKNGEARFHPTQKPIDVMVWAISLAGDIQTILDPFSGSGTTGRAAKDLGKSAVLIEREERYCEIAANRMEQEILAF